MGRRHASDEDFRLVGLDRDPTPGDPDLIRDIVDRYRDIGDAAQTALDILKKDGAISQGRGSAMDKLREKIGDDLPDKLNKTATSYHDAAQAYTDYIPRLQEAQDTFDQAVDQAVTASAKANRTPKTLGENPTDQEKSEARAVQDDIDAGKNDLSAAKSLAEQARQMRESAQSTCSDTLDRAASEAIPERNIFQKIADFFKDFPFVQILLAALIAVVAVFFPVVGALLGGALFVFNQVIASQTGGIKAGDFITGLIGLIPGGSLFKLGGKAIEAFAPGLAAAIKNSPSIPKISSSITKISEAGENNKTLGVVIDLTGGFVENSAIEVAAKAANHDKITAAGVFAGAAAGAGAGVVFKGIVGKIGSARGNPDVQPGKGGQFGDTTEPSIDDSIGKKVSDQVGGIIQEGATVGAKIGVGIAQGGDPNDVAAGEIANSAPKIGVGPIGIAGVGHKIDGIPIKGNIGGGGTTGPATGGHGTHTPAPRPVDPVDVPLPASPSTPTPPLSPTTPTAPAGPGVGPVAHPSDIPLPASPTTPTPPLSPTTPTAPAGPGVGPVAHPSDIPLPASPSTPTPPLSPTTPTAPAGSATDPAANPSDVPLPPSPTTP
ncbi:putative T7SS-secreted protein [Streptomyces sp. NPDC004008]